MKSIFLTFLLILAAVTSHAQISVKNGDDTIVVVPDAPLQNPKFVQRFRQAAIRALERAEQSGLKEVQGIRLADIKKAAATVLIEYNARIKIRQANRRCAYWNHAVKDAQVIGTGKRVDVPAKINLYNDCESLSDAELESLALHEILGVSFNADLKYEISTQILSPRVSQKPGKSLINIKAHDARLQQMKSSGGSTGVGGGGDFHDLRFKTEGLKFLDSLKQDKVFGIPVELLRIAVREMNVSPARDIEKLVEFRGPGIEKSEAIAYIMSSLYRDKSVEGLGFLAAFTARLFIIHAPQDLGLVEDNSPSILSLRDSTLVQDRCFYLAAPEERFRFIHWSNPKLKTNASECADQIVEAVGFSSTPQGQALLKTLNDIAVVRVVPSEF